MPACTVPSLMLISHDRIKCIIAQALVPLRGSVESQKSTRSVKKSNGIDSNGSLSTAVKLMEYLQHSLITKEILPVGL